MSVDVGSALGYLDLDTSGWNRGFKSAMQDLETFNNKSNALGDRLTSLGSAMTTTGSTMTKWVTTPLVGIGTAAFAVGNEFESAMSRVQAISGATGEQFEQLEAQAMDLGATTSFSATEAALGMENLASAGFTVEEIMEAMPGLLNLAASSGAELGDAAEIAASAVRGFGLEASETAHVADVFAEAAARTNAQTEDMGEAMKYIAPVAKAMGMSLEETAAAVGILSDAGIKGSQAGTSLRGALSRLAKPTDAMRATMEALGLSFFDTEGNMLSLQGIVAELEEGMAGLTQEQRNNALVTLFGQESLSGMLTLMERGSEELGTLTTEFENVSGSAEEMAEIMMDNTAGAIEELGGALETAAINIQQVLAPAITNVVQWLTELVNKFNQLPDETQRLIVFIAGLVAALGPFLLILGKIVTGIGGMVSAFGKAKGIFGVIKTALTGLAGGFGPVLAMIAAVVAAVVGLYVAWENNFMGIQEVAASIGESLQSIWESILAGVESFWEWLLSLWENNFAFCQDIIGAAWETIQTVFGDALDIIMNVFQGFANLLEGDWDGLWENVKNIGSAALDLLGAIIDGALKFFVGLFLGIGTELWSAATEAFEWISQAWDEVWTSICDWFEEVKEDPVQALSDLGSSLYDTACDVMSDFWDGLCDVWEDICDWAESVVSWIQDLFSFEASPTVNVPTHGGSGGSFASGLDYVPRDMIVQVHEGESIRTKQQTKQATKTQTSKPKQPLIVNMTVDRRTLGRVVIEDINDITDADGTVPIKI